ncbi:hypothetical protein HDV02_002336 [Globomyces sp. JEL0801]|nr:hypothetical protein HDV02_002336 [Globomyces sp. JEL0801]
MDFTGPFPPRSLLARSNQSVSSRLSDYEIPRSLPGDYHPLERNPIFNTIALNNSPDINLNIVASAAQDEDSSLDPKKSALETLFESRPRPPNSSTFPVLKLKGIPWDTTIAEIHDLFPEILIPHGHRYPYFTECVHIIMDRNTGKTLNECYVEFPTNESYKYAISIKHKLILRERRIYTEKSTQAELNRALFPKYYVKEGELPDIEIGGTFVTREEIASLLNTSRTIRSRIPGRLYKCVERPFETIISILSKVSWYNPTSISTIQRDHIFEMVKRKSPQSLIITVAVEAAKSTNNKDYNGVIDRVIRAALCVPLFTEKQMQCPKDLLRYVYTPEEEEGGVTQKMIDSITSIERSKPVWPSTPSRPNLISGATFQTSNILGESKLKEALQNLTLSERKLAQTVDSYNKLWSEYKLMEKDLEAVKARYTTLQQHFAVLEQFCCEIYSKAGKPANRSDFVNEGSSTQGNFRRNIKRWENHAIPQQPLKQRLNDNYLTGDENYLAKFLDSPIHLPEIHPSQWVGSTYRNSREYTVGKTNKIPAVNFNPFEPKNILSNVSQTSVSNPVTDQHTMNWLSSQYGLPKF